MAVNVNRVGYKRRHAVVERILQSHGLQPSSISTIAYTEIYPHFFNNYLYKVELAFPASISSFPGTQPGTIMAPTAGVPVLVIKLSNLAAGMNDANRVENDVASQALVRHSMAQSGLAPLVPAVYAWAPAKIAEGTEEICFGWTMSEFRSGVDLDSEFSSLDFKDKEQVLQQIAAILAAIQAARFPEGVNKFGGLTFNSSGQIVSGEAPLLKGDPVSSYTELIVAKLRTRLEDAAESSLIQGWNNNGVSTKIESFIMGGGVGKVLVDVDLHRKGLIHGDFTTNNMLYDKGTKAITAILDFDWAHVSNPFEEFATILGDIGCNITEADNDVNRAMLSGIFAKPPAGSDEESTKRWELAEMWSKAMRRESVICPSDIKGAEGILDIFRLHTLLCPYPLGNENKLKMLDDAKKVELRAKAEVDLVLWLEKYGF